MSEVKQYDTSETIIGGKNITEAVHSEKRLVFNESYSVVGSKLSAPSVYACYDLTIVGDVEVDEIEIRGNLYVMGNITAKRLSCSKSVFCSGNIEAKEIYASDVIANDIKCGSINCLGNITVLNTVDVGESLSTEKSVMAGEGILGSGHFSAKSATAVEYFDFSGEVSGRVLELDTDEVFGVAHSTLEGEYSIEELTSKIKDAIKSELKKAGDISENCLVSVVKQISEKDDILLSDWDELTENLVDLSYLDKIANLRDYLICFLSQKILPTEIVGYETLSHVFDDLMVEAGRNTANLPFKAKNIDDFVLALKIVSFLGEELGIEKDDLLDRIFQSIGIKYKTVKSFFERE